MKNIKLPVFKISVLKFFLNNKYKAVIHAQTINLSLRKLKKSLNRVI